MLEALLFGWMNAMPSSPNTLNRATGEYCAPKTPPPNTHVLSPLLARYDRTRKCVSAFVPTC